MWVFLVVPVLVIAIISLVGALRRPPALPGSDPEGLRTVVSWRDPTLTAVDVAGDPLELLRQVVGALAEKRYIFSSSIARKNDPGYAGPLARIDVQEHRFELRVRPFGGGGWFLWIEQNGTAPEDSDDLRQLLTGMYRMLEAREAESVSWHRRERSADHGAAGPFYVE